MEYQRRDKSVDEVIFSLGMLGHEMTENRSFEGALEEANYLLFDFLYSTEDGRRVFVAYAAAMREIEMVANNGIY